MNSIKTLLSGIIITSMAASCQKKENDKCEDLYAPGFSRSDATIWISEDKGWGELTLYKLYYFNDDGTKKEGDIYSTGKIDRYFTSEPECGAEGTISFFLKPGQKAEYQLISNNGTIYDGWIRAACETGCHYQDLAQY